MRHFINDQMLKILNMTGGVEMNNKYYPKLKDSIISYIATARHIISIANRKTNVYAYLKQYVFIAFELNTKCFGCTQKS